MKHFIITRIEDGVISNISKLVKLCAPLKDGTYEFSVKHISKRSNSQNAYYWAILTDYVQPALYDQGWNDIKTKDDAHFFVSDLFLKTRVVNEQTGEVKERIKSTTELSKEDFGVYLEEIWAWSAEYLGVAIPSPGESLTMQFETT